MTWYRAARVCDDLHEDSKLATVWSTSEAAHIAKVRNGKSAWVFGFYEDGEWNLNFAEQQLWSPSEPKDESAFAFCAQQSDDKESTLRFQSATCHGKITAVCKKCPTRQHHFAERNERAINDEFGATRPLSSVTTTTTTTTTTTEGPDIGGLAGTHVGGPGHTVAAAGTQSSATASIVAGAGNVVFTFALVNFRK